MFTIQRRAFTFHILLDGEEVRPHSDPIHDEAEARWWVHRFVQDQVYSQGPFD